MKNALIIIVFCFIGLWWNIVQGQAVSNVRVVQDGNMVKIHYDLNQTSDVTIFISPDGGERWYSLDGLHITGAAGKDVSPGKGKYVLWDVLKDKDELIGSRYRFKVVAEYNPDEQRDISTQNNPKTTKANNNKTASQSSMCKFFEVNDVRFAMIKVEGGSFTIGCTNDQDSECDSDEKPCHRVTLNDYYIGEAEVTQGLWQSVMGDNPSIWINKEYPVNNISWEDCKKFVKELNAFFGTTKFRLPTEAEWEFAARGGNKSQGYKYSGSNDIEDVAWFNDNSNGLIHPVKSKQPNELGIYDMSGNVGEWCIDWYGSYISTDQTNPIGAYSGDKRILRGGNFYALDKYCRISSRFGARPPEWKSKFNGIRLVYIP